MTRETNGEYAFNSQGLSEEEIGLNILLREKFAALADTIDAITDDETVAVNPRYRALAMTHLEIAGMFATKMLSHNALP